MQELSLDDFPALPGAPKSQSNAREVGGGDQASNAQKTGPIERRDSLVSSTQSAVQSLTAQATRGAYSSAAATGNLQPL
jgi:hypothetical protein